MLLRLTVDQVKQVIKDDPVRPHISADWRTNNGSEVYGLYKDDNDKILRAIICVTYTSEVPTCERDLDLSGSSIAVFYTVWSYDRGAGRDIVFKVAEHIKNTKKNIKRYVTLSPLTDMARNFHLKNGAKFIHKHMDCQNFEYE
jgi:hypothetical protein